MKKIFIISFKLFILVWSILAGKANAFYCSDDYRKNFSYSVDSFAVGREENINLALPSSVLTCRGDDRDALRIYSVTLNPKLVTAGFTTSTFQVSSSNYTYPFTGAINICVWGNCSSAGGPVNNRTANTPTFKPTLKRTPGVWPDLTMSSGETLFTIQLQQRGDTGSGIKWYELYTISYVLSGPITTPDYTCAINTYDNTVDLPTVPASNIRAQSAGKVNSSKTRFNIQLDCEKYTRVSLQFDGSKMSGTGTDDVLVNQTSGNDNIGVQLYRADTGTAIAFGSPYIAVDSADTSESMPFDAYYYYKGGSVSGGELKSTATFTFTYE